mgnify:CR=1 FL=1
MGVKHPPYNLRTNKAIDRLLLANILMDLKIDDSKCRYYSFGGPFLEDLRVMDHFFPNMILTSLEKDTETYKRQDFHRFNSRLQLKRMNFHEFLISYEPGIRDIFWLDYTNIKYEYFSDFMALLVKVPIDSVVRITLRAEPEFRLDYLIDKISNTEFHQIKSQLEADFINEFQKIMPVPPVSAFSNILDFSKMVQDMVKIAASRALDISGSKTDFMPIQCTRYNDNTNMLSITGIVYERSNISNIKKILKNVRFLNNNWCDPIEINIPNLSLKERLYLEKMLPVEEEVDAGELLFDTLKYCITDGQSQSKKELRNYADYYRDYPNFIRTMM